MAEMKKCLTPWHIDDEYSTVIADSNGTKIACVDGLLNGDVFSQEEEEAIAARIVKSVNCHDELLAALKDACELIVLLSTAHAACRNSAEIRRIDAAIAHAEAQP